MLEFNFLIDVSKNLTLELMTAFQIRHNVSDLNAKLNKS